MGMLKEVARFTSDFANCGILYAIAKARINYPAPLDPVENWQFWTTPTSPLIDFLIKAHPSQATQKAYLESMWQNSHADGIEAHYDVSNDFYDLFLDTKYKFYTCAEYYSETETIEQAQENKANYLRSLMRLSGDEKILDLGCGWGAMLKFLRDSGHRGELSGYTLSKEQLAYNQSLGFNASLTNFITDPFEGAPYDRIYSIGSFEHIRPQELKSVYQKVYDALTPNGLAVHQFFSFECDPKPSEVLLGQIFFPGSILSPHTYHLEVAQSVGFKITHDSIHDYKPTLRAWYDRLVENQEKALQIVDVQTYNRYMTFFPTSWVFFQKKQSDLHRIVMEKV